MLDARTWRDFPAEASRTNWETPATLLDFHDGYWPLRAPAVPEPSPLLFLPECETRRVPPPDWLPPLCLGHDDLDTFTALSQGQALLDAVAEFGLDAGWQRSTKRLPQTGDQSLSLTDVDLKVRLLEEQQLQWHVGFGMQVLDRAQDFYLGYALTTALHLRVAEQFDISAQGEVGRVDAAGVRHGRASVGVSSRQLPHLDVYSGFDFFEIGSERWRVPIFGMRFKF
ncbi:MAG: hypothetical protein JNM56_36055 [Planctomycetia bacterium]|nr:hypothetical protein [Planctomycetia bacterium]